MAGKNLSNLVSVYGPGVSKPLLSTNDARLIQIRDSDGELVSMFIRLTDSMWGFVTKGDPDWDATKERSSVDDSEV